MFARYLSTHRIALTFAALLAGSLSLQAQTAISGDTINGNLTVTGNINGLKIGLGGANETTNNAIGLDALLSNIDGTSIIAIGGSALFSNTHGTQNIAVGLESLYSNTLGNRNVAIGIFALSNNIDGSDNIAIGFDALSGSAAGSQNVAIGKNAGFYRGAILSGLNVLESPVNSIYLGTDARGLNNAESNSIVIGYQAIGMGTNTTVIGNEDTAIARIYGVLKVDDILVNEKTVLTQEMAADSYQPKSAGLTDIANLTTTSFGTGFLPLSNKESARGYIGAGTVNSVSVVAANGISGSVADGTTTPAITLDISGLDATKIGAGVVTSSEFGYIGELTSDAQTQIDGKQPLDSRLTTLAAGFGGPFSLSSGFVKWNGQTSDYEISGFFPVSSTWFQSGGRILTSFDVNISGSGKERTPSEVLDWIGSTRGSILYRGDYSNGWKALPPGPSGNVLTSNGAGSDPSYAPLSLGSGNSVSGALRIVNGGTGQSTQTAAFDALAPSSVQGDMIYYNGADNVSLPKGAPGQVLTMNAGGTAPVWAPNYGLAVGATAIGNSTTGGILYDNSGTLGVKTVTGTGSVVLNASPTISGSLMLSGGTITQSTPVINATQTWDSSSTTFTGIKLNILSGYFQFITNSSRLMDLQVDNVSKFSVSKQGYVVAAGYRNAAGQEALTQAVADTLYLTPALANNAYLTPTQANGTYITPAQVADGYIQKGGTGLVIGTRIGDANADNSVVLGLSSYASSGSVSIGPGAGANGGPVSGVESVAVGFMSRAPGLYAIAMGRGTWAAGPESSALGHGSYTRAIGGVALGRGAGSTQVGQVVLGSYNVESPESYIPLSTDDLLIVGNGTSDAPQDRSNAFVIKRNGDTEIKGAAHVQGSIDVQQNTNVQGNLNVQQNATVTGQLIISNPAGGIEMGEFGN